MGRGSNKKTSTTTTHHVGGAIRMPAEYYGNDSGRYYPSGAPELATPSCQRPASFGTIFPDGTVGPILRTQTGGRRHRSHPHQNAMKNHNHHKHNSKSKKNTKSKSRKLSLKMMSKKLERMSKRLSQKVKKMRTNVTMGL